MISGLGGFPVSAYKYNFKKSWYSNLKNHLAVNIYWINTF